MEIITKPAYTVTAQLGSEGERTTTQFGDPEAAAAAVVAALAVVKVDLADFGGQVSWSVEEVPATPFDELLDEYMHELHDEGGLDGVEREAPYLMVEENVRGGYWLSSGDDPAQLATQNLKQEYSEDWELVGIFDARTGDQVSGTTEVTIRY